MLSRVFTCIVHTRCLTLRFHLVTLRKKYLQVTRCAAVFCSFCWSPSFHHYFYLNKTSGSQRLIILQQCLRLTFYQAYVIFFFFLILVNTGLYIIFFTIEVQVLTEILRVEVTSVSLADVQGGELAK